MFNYRKNAYIPPPPPPLFERIQTKVREWAKNLQKNLSSWWQFNKDSVKGFGAASVALGFFLCCCYGIAAGQITLTTPSSNNRSFHHDRIGSVGHVGHIGHVGRIGRSRTSHHHR